VDGGEWNEEKGGGERGREKEGGRKRGGEKGGGRSGGSGVARFEEVSVDGAFKNDR